MKVEEIVTNDELALVFDRTDFGALSPRQVLSLGVLKCASGYYQGHTSKNICMVLDLIDNQYQLTAKGRSYLWSAFSNGSNF